MTFRINQISVDIRKNLAKEVKDNEVNRKKETIIDNKMKRPFVKEHEKEKEEKKKKNRYITINGVKDIKKKQIVEAEGAIDLLGQASTGLVLDEIK